MKSFFKERTILILSDVLFINLAFILALLLRFEGQVPSQYWITHMILFLPLTVVYFFFFYLFRLYKHLWRYASISELFSIFFAVSAGTFFFFLLSAALPGYFFPRSVLLNSWILLLFFTGGSRIMLRIYRQYYNESSKFLKREKKRVLIIGAGDAGEMVLRELKKHMELNYQVMGFVDDNVSKQGLEIHGVRVFGTSRDLQILLLDLRIDEAIIAIPSAPGKEVKRLVDICKRGGVNVKILPGVYEIIGEQVHVSQIRDVQVEDLLRREQVVLDQEDICGYIRGKAVMVTGGGGSIGAELCRQVVKFNPRSLIIFDINENNIFETLENLEGVFPCEQMYSVVGSIQDQDRLRSVFLTHKPQVIFHAAAHKHVPLMEYNPGEAIKNNVFGTRNVAQLAHEFQVERFVMISTDKAVNPTNVMGASKRLAEMIVERINQSSQTCFMTVRFGNVLGSKGSVIPTFKRQIEKGGPVKVTHRDITRYFMTIPESAQLVIQAGAMGQGGEVFLLDMGEPVRILDLAKELIRLSGLEPGRDIEIQFVGLRPGEKLFEELLTAEEASIKTTHEKIFVALLHSVNPILLETKLKELERIVQQSSNAGPKIRAILCSILDSYTPEAAELPREKSLLEI